MSTAALSPASTIGMKLDGMIAELDNLSSTQLYALIVAATVAVCLVVLGTGNSHQDASTTSMAAAMSASKTTSVPKKGRQPRFWIFKYVNVGVSLLFLASVIHFAMNAPEYMEHLNSFLIGWSVLLCYFFGFFGVSLIHTDLLVEENTVATSANKSLGR